MLPQLAAGSGGALGK